MPRVSEIQNTSKDDVKVKLTGGPEVTISPKSSLKNVDVDNLESLGSNVKVTNDLTEVNQATGKTRLNG